MAERAVAGQAVTGQAVAEPGHRGRTDIADAVVEHIACHAASEVEGVASVGSGLDKLVGRRYPKADAQVAGGRARVSVEIAVVWPRSLAFVGAEVRETVTTRLRELSGLDIDAVDVSIAKVLLEEQQERRRVQ